ncbi:MAG: tRNA (adenosine(37)-N6)-dimethylallyltransferase MiaA, partial [Bacteroidales bacterium]|nr:tRNA (adenosine(37)-N6)-dimethylallyltransferase MiaA [Bacteroidales bacterium]
MIKTVYFVVGPTAVGKTAFAIRLAKYLDTEIISADSRQFFREMNIGTAMPSEAELAQIKHHLIGNLSIHQNYNVSEFEQDALALLEQLFQTKEAVVVVGGSGLYLDALAFGIDNLPDASEELRIGLKQLYDQEGIEALQTKLEALDPVFYQQIDKQNPKRLLRALEVCLTSGKPYSDLRIGQKKKRDFEIKWIGLEQERSILNKKINQRVDVMLENGLLAEVKQLYRYKDLNALHTVGYKEFFVWLDGEESFEWAVEKVKTNSRRYAKRQMTWFRKKEAIHWLNVDHLPELGVIIELFQSENRIKS